MSTIGKALSLLDHISQLDKDTGLTDLARLAALDKATARRFLVELERHGFVEQDEETRKYRLGAAPVRCAVVEDTVTGVTAGVAAGASVFAYAPLGDGAALQAAGAVQLFRSMAELPALLGC